MTTPAATHARTPATRDCSLTATATPFHLGVPVDHVGRHGGAVQGESRVAVKIVALGRVPHHGWPQMPGPDRCLEPPQTRSTVSGESAEQMVQRGGEAPLEEGAERKIGRREVSSACD